MICAHNSTYQNEFSEIDAASNGRIRDKKTSPTTVWIGFSIQSIQSVQFGAKQRSQIIYLYGVNLYVASSYYNNR